MIYLGRHMPREQLEDAGNTVSQEAFKPGAREANQALCDALQAINASIAIANVILLDIRDLLTTKEQTRP